MRIHIESRSRFSRSFIIAASTAATLLLASSPGSASANLPYCMAGETTVECNFATYNQCQAAAQNIGRSCMSNPDHAATYASADMPPMSPTPRIRTMVASADTEGVRRMCIAEAQARHPDNGLGTTTVMTQRTLVYADCARSNGIRP